MRFLIAAIAALVVLSGADAQAVDFERDVQPLLARHCYTCHGQDTQEGDLRLDTRAAALAGGKHGPVIVPGQSAASRLVQFVRGENDDKIVMPPEGQRLLPGEIALLAAWIDQSAAWPEVGSARESKAATHWAFRPPARGPAPPIKNAARAHNAIDAFVLARLEERQIEPSPEADRVTLIRRLSLDLLGLPPSPKEVSRFVHDTSADAYEMLVDRLLASPHFGERWARHWLDLARYADSSGYEFDIPRSVWRYRDWVIDALNADMPFDRFAIEQIAGDLLPDATTSQTIASGFHCNAMLDPNLRWEAVLDQVNTTGTVFLGLTVGCAQCHSHKFDPISQREFFQLYAFFDHAGISDFELASPAEKQSRDVAQARVDELKKQQETYKATLVESLDAWVTSLTADERAKLPAVAQTSLTTNVKLSTEQVNTLMAARTAADARYQEMSRKIDRCAKQVPKLPATLAMRAEPRETRLFVRGNPERPGEAVSPGVPAFLHPLANSSQPNRLDLARWLVARDNPLVARVTVNRLWQHYFGLGLVETANDFGVQTAAPVQQDLLDWLATEFMDSSWSLKHIHRLIVCSATYRQSSRNRADLSTIDPQNRLLARQRRLRVEAEVVRDLALAASGRLATKVGGPSVFPYQAEGVLDDRATKATWTMSPGEDRYRRGLYTWAWRLTPHPMLSLFDAPDASMACTRRDRSNTPVQALTLLNDPTFLECARALASRVLDPPPVNDRAGVERAFELCLSRAPQPDEADLLLALWRQQQAELAADDEAARKIAGAELPAGTEASKQAAWIVVCRSLLSVDEFLTRE